MGSKSKGCGGKGPCEAVGFHANNHTDAVGRTHVAPRCSAVAPYTETPAIT